mmetsp:Transcript_16194/g.44784  ORF Transcript_16194/g.44784 Transcript_16194/m.44784 type:complete len:210 (-) Transcript_16194:32-661(-)
MSWSSTRLPSSRLPGSWSVTDNTDFAIPTISPRSVLALCKRQAVAAGPRRGTRKCCTGSSPRRLRNRGLAPLSNNWRTPAAKPRSTAKCNGVFRYESTGWSRKPRHGPSFNSFSTCANLSGLASWIAPTRRLFSTNPLTMALTMSRSPSSKKVLTSRWASNACIHASPSPCKAKFLRTNETEADAEEKRSSCFPNQAVDNSEKHHPDSI